MKKLRIAHDKVGITPPKPPAKGKTVAAAYSIPAERNLLDESPVLIDLLKAVLLFKVQYNQELLWN